jgi:hypothetical protein
MDLSVLWCLGPDFDKQTVFNLLGDSNYIESALAQPTTPNWWASSPSQWNNASMQEAPIYTPRSVMSELGPQSPTSGATKRPFSDLSNRTTSEKNKDLYFMLKFIFLFLLVGRPFTGNQPPPPKLEFSTPVRSLTPDLYSRVSSSIKRSRVAPTLISSSYETPPPPQPMPSMTSTIDSAE